MSLDDINASMKNYRNFHSEEAIDDVFQNVMNYKGVIPAETIHEISLLIDPTNNRKNPYFSDMFAVFNIIFQGKSLYFLLPEEEKLKLIKNMENAYGITSLLSISRQLSGTLESIFADMDNGYLEKYKNNFINEQFKLFNIMGDKYREFLIDNIDRHAQTFKLCMDVVKVNSGFVGCVPIATLHKTLRYMENKGNAVIANLLEKKDKKILHHFYWLYDSADNSNNSSTEEEIKVYEEYIIEKMESAGLCLKDVLDFSQKYSQTNNTCLVYFYFNYALEKEPETADIIMDYLINSGEEPKVIEQLQVLKNKKEKKDLIYKIEVINNDKKEKVLRI